MTQSIEQLRAALKEAEDAQKAIDLTASKERNRRITEITKDDENYEWLAKPHKNTVWGDRDREVTGVYLSRRLKPEVIEMNPDLTFSENMTRWHGMFYYRTEEGILAHDGGGYHVLRTIPMLCSDDQWERFQRGDIDGKFRR